MQARPSEPDDERYERLFDEYLALALEGAAPSPAEFLAARGGADASFRERLEELARTSARAPQRSVDALPFEELGDYRLIERIGRGGMGQVFRAEQRSLRREVALKLLRPELAGSNVAAERLKREALAVARLRHPGIVTVHDFGEERGVRYLAMEYVPGRTLDEALSAGPVTLARKVSWIRDLARALDYAHSAGVVHRDVKPSNVRITPDDRALLVDFGLVRSLEEGGATLTESFAGSPAYASPEQIRSSASVDGRSDIYSLGVTLYRCLTAHAPFEGDTLERVFHQILTADPLPPRRIDASIPRDLELVTLKAIEREPERRYASAGEFADDLDAVLELRPVRARPPSWFERGLRTARRHRASAAASAVAALALIAFGVWTMARAESEREQRRAQAHAALASARERVASYHSSRARFAELEREVARLVREIDYRWLAPEEYRVLDERQLEVEALRRDWETSFYAVLDALSTAERLDPSIDGVDAVRAELYAEKFREAQRALRDGEAEFYRSLVERHDASGELAAELRASSTVRISSNPPGARVRLHRYVELATLMPGGDARSVPVPFRGERIVPAPGSLCLRVTRACGALRPGDLIVELLGQPIEGSLWIVGAGARGELRELDRLVEVAGQPIRDGWDVDFIAIDVVRDGAGVPQEREFVFERGEQRLSLRGRSLRDFGVQALTAAELGQHVARGPLRCRVAREGELLELELPPAAPVRATAAPLCHSTESELGRTPLAPIELNSGDWVAVLELDGWERAVRPFTAAAGEQVLDVVLRPIGAAPEGFVELPRAGEPVWICEREVTSAEYLEFLNDPATLARIAASPTLILAPRQGSGASVQAAWESAEGLWRLPADWAPTVPVVGISWHDARAFAQWRTERERAAGGVWEYALPDYNEYQQAGIAGTRRVYSWGRHFRAKWSRSCFARPRASIGPVLQFPIDESPLGVFDLCGSAMEWLDAWYDAGRGMRRLGGGAWGQSMAHVVAVSGGLGAPPDATSGETGMRLVARRAGEQAR